MKNKYLLTIVVLALGVVIVASVGKNTKKSYIPRTTINKNNSFSAGGALKWQNERRANQNTGIVDIRDVEAARKQVEALSMKKGTSALNLEWTELGPDNVGGRTRALLIDRNNHQVMYAGGVAGGLWKSISGGLSWQLLDDSFTNIAISSICQTTNGDIYFGTGESFAGAYGISTTTNGALGKGIWKSTNGTDFTHLASTWTDTITWQFVNELAASPTDPNTVYAATNKGLMVTTDGGTTWSNPISGTIGTNACTDVKVANDGTVIVAFNAPQGYMAYLSPDGSDGSFVRISDYTDASLLPITDMGRLEFAFAPSDNNYIYCLAANSEGGLKNVYLSTDKGNTWEPILDGTGEGVMIFGDNTQGWYDNTIAVYPDNKNKIICGGIDLWKWEKNNAFEQISYWQEWAGDYYVHADQHVILFHPEYGNGNNTIFFANDGGVFRSANGGSTFIPVIKKYLTTQFYSVAFSGDGRVIGGTQDNGTQYIDYLGNTAKTAVEVLGGDGGGCIIPILHPNVIIASIYYGQVRRSGDRENDMEVTNSWINSPWISSKQYIGTPYEPFVTRMDIWESFYDTLSIDSVEYIAKQAYSAGDVITAKSDIYKRPLYYTLTDTLHEGDTIKIQDTYQAALAVGLNGNVWVTRYPLNFSKDWVGENYWYPVIDTTTLPFWNIFPNDKRVKPIGEVTALAWSKDGNYLYVGTQYNYYQNGDYISFKRVYRVSNLLHARTMDDLTAMSHDSPLDEDYALDSYDTLIVTETQILGEFDQIITDIAVDPSNPNNIVVTLGNYGNNDYVYFSTNAATTTSTDVNTNFVSIQGNLPKMPVYTAMINWSDSREVILGTEYGIYSTDNVLASTVDWTDQNTNIPRVPVYMLRQQKHENFWADGNSGVTNHGIIYAATHGRGLFKCETLKGPVAVEELPVADKVNLNNIMLYPNPVSEVATIDYTLSQNSNVEIKVYNLSGKLVKYQMLTNKTKGSHKYSFDVNKLAPGTYIVNIYSEGDSKSTKFIVN